MTLPGGPMTQRELVDLLKTLGAERVSFFLLATVDGRVATFPQFRATPEVPDVPAFLRRLADELELDVSRSPDVGI